MILIAAAAAVYYHHRHKLQEQLNIETAYVIPASVDVIDTPAEIHSTLRSLKSGDRVAVVSRAARWAQIRLADGRTGWVEAKALLDAATHEKAEQVLKSVEPFGPQAAGHTTNATNLRLEPSRESIQLAELSQNVPVQVFGRQLVARTSSSQGGKATPSQGKPRRDVWYLVRAQSKAGWVLGRLISLDVPEAITAYAQETNLVAWLVLNTVNDGGHEVPQYLVADRVGTQELDFNHIRVFTWWVKHRKYVTAYVESNLNGYFPIRVVHGLDKPYFRLRLVDDEGEKYQKVYGLFTTIVRPLGTVKGWESEEMPATLSHGPRRGGSTSKRARRPGRHRSAAAVEPQSGRCG